uniref:Uncharacterized protein n=1 Tax=Solanum lycopersicum TaxID=4081 RepID=A0A3Q7I190_SOLLC
MCTHNSKTNHQSRNKHSSYRGKEDHNHSRDNKQTQRLPFRKLSTK